jgi:hypothetical protein
MSGSGGVSAVTIATWFKINVSGNDSGIMDFSLFNGDDGQLGITLNGSDQLRFFTGTAQYQTYASALTVGRWYHVACTYDESLSGNEKKIYLDGVLVSEQTEGTNPDLGETGLKLILGSYYSAAYGLDGNVAEAAVWSSALSASAISEIYNGGIPVDLTLDKGSYDQSSNMSAWLRLGDSASFDGTNWSIDNIVSSSYATGSSVNMTFTDRVIDAPPTMVNTLRAPYPVALSGSKAATIAFWAKVGSTGLKEEYLIGDAARQGWEIRKGGTNNFQFAVLTGSSAGATASFVTDHAIPDNNSEGTSSGFAHYALTYEGGSGQIIGYVQGSGSSYGKLYETASLDFQTGSFVDTAGQGTLRFGRLTDEIGSGWLGSIAEVAIWSSSLSASAISDLAEGPFDVASKTTTNYTATSSLVSYWTVTSGSYSEDT